MTYQERYTALAGYLQVSTTYLQEFEVFAQCFEMYFPKIFDLNELNHAAELVLADEGKPVVTQLKCFALCLDELQTRIHDNVDSVRELTQTLITNPAAFIYRPALRERRLGRDSGFTMLRDTMFSTSTVLMGSPASMTGMSHTAVVALRGGESELSMPEATIRHEGRGLKMLVERKGEAFRADESHITVKTGMNHFQDKEVDIYEYPPTCSAAFTAKEQIAIGDLHANPIKLLYSLLHHGVVTMPKPDYDALVELYQNIALSSELTREYLARYRELLSSIKLVDGALGRVTLIGDETCDRGENDLLILELLGKMQEVGVNYEILLSNHGASFVEAYEKKEPFGSTIIDSLFIRSSTQLQASINSSLVTRAEVDDLITKAYKPALNLLSYVISEDGEEINIYSHAGIGWQSLSGLCKFLPVEKKYADSTLLELAATLDRINAAFIVKRNSNQIYTLCPRIIAKKGNDGMQLCPEGEAIVFMLWNRFYGRMFVDRCVDLKGYRVNFIHGHDNETISLDNTFSLDSDLGKAVTLNKGKYNILASHGFATLEAYSKAHSSGVDVSLKVTRTESALTTYGLFSGVSAGAGAGAVADNFMMQEP